jgi:hypothetical protein
MSNPNEHYVTLNSGACRHLFPKNTASVFRTKLCETINLHPVSTHWECAATLAHVPANYNNITDYCRKIFIKKSKRSKSELRKEYTIPRYVWSDYTVPHEIENLTASEFVKHINNSMLISDHRNFKLELSTIGVEKKKYSSSAPVADILQGDDTPVFVFRIGKDAKLVFNVDGMAFWTQYIELSASLIGHQITQSFTVPIRADPGSKYIRVMFPLTIRVFSKSGEVVRSEIIPKIFPDDDTKILHITKGSYKNVQVLINEIKSTLENEIVEKNDDGTKKEVFKLTVNNDNTLTFEILHTRYAILFPDDLAYALGFRKNEWYSEVENRGLLPIDLHYNLNTIYVYSDVVTSSIVSSEKAPLLTLLPVKQRTQDRIVPHYFPRLFYYPVNKTNISEISISMVGDYGREIPFAEAVETTLKLHFRVYKE